MLTEKDYCDKDLSATLIEMGFRGFGHFYYGKDSSKLKTTHQFLTARTTKALNLTLAVSLYEAQEFLREEKKIHIEIDLLMSKWYPTIVSYNRLKLVELKGCESYEEALSEGIKEAVKILKEK